MIKFCMRHFLILVPEEVAYHRSVCPGKIVDYDYKKMKQMMKDNPKWGR